MNELRTSLGPVDKSSYDAIIFDLGGVILTLNYGVTIGRFTELLGRDARDIYQETVQSGLFDAFERGELEASAFRDKLRSESKATQAPSDAELDEAFNAILGRIPDGHLELLASLHKQKRTFLLSNTNSIHLERFLADYEERHAAEFGVFSDLFEKAYYSHELGLRKPEPRAFRHILDQHHLEAQRTLFIDDNEHNVRAASELGILSRLHPRNEPLFGYFR
jgi:glucose-1-phosphatase